MPAGIDSRPLMAAEECEFCVSLTAHESLQTTTETQRVPPIRRSRSGAAWRRQPFGLGMRARGVGTSLKLIGSDKSHHDTLRTLL